MLNKNVTIMYYRLGSNIHYQIVAQWDNQQDNWTDYDAASARSSPNGVGDSEQEAKQNLILATREHYNVK